MPEIRCIDADGTMIGVIRTSEAQKNAQAQGLDLVEVSPTAKPPVCRIMDYGKYRYDLNRKQKAARKQSHAHALKEIKFHSNVEEHDYQFKRNRIVQFLEKGHKVKVSLMFRGRENAHRELGFALIERVIKDCADLSSVDMQPRLMGRHIVSMLSPAADKPTRKQADAPKAEAKPRKPAPAAEPKAEAETADEPKKAPPAEPEAKDESADAPKKAPSAEPTGRTE